MIEVKYNLKLAIEAVIAHGENMSKLPQNKRLGHLKAMLDAIDRLQERFAEYQDAPPTWDEQQHEQLLRLRREKATQRQIEAMFK